MGKSQSMAGNKDCGLFLKIGKAEHIQSLHLKGEVYCKDLQFFRGLGDPDQGDAHECASRVEKITGGEIRKNGVTVAPFHATHIYWSDPNVQGNLFCVYGIESDQFNPNTREIQKVLVEQEIEKFGKSVLLIYDLVEFKRRLMAEVRKEFEVPDLQWVTYYNAEYEGPLTPFNKRDKYSYQNEVRLWIPNDIKGPKKFHLGNLSEISHVLSIDEIDDITLNFPGEQTSP